MANDIDPFAPVKPTQTVEQPEESPPAPASNGAAPQSVTVTPELLAQLVNTIVEQRLAQTGVAPVGEKVGPDLDVEITDESKQTVKDAYENYQELPLPDVTYPNRMLYAVQMQGVAGAWPAQLVKECKADIVDVTAPWVYPKLRPGEKVVDHRQAFAKPTPKSHGRVTIRGWKILGGPFKERMAFELPHAAILTSLKKPIIAVYAWCPAAGEENKRFREHGLFWGTNQALTDDTPNDLMLSRRQKPHGQCTRCLKNQDSDEGGLVENAAMVHDAISRRAWYLGGR